MSERDKEWVRLHIMDAVTDLIINKGDAMGGYRHKTGWECLAPIKQVINESFRLAQETTNG